MASLSDIDMEVQTERDALAASQDRDDRALQLDSLSVALGERFSITANPADLEEAIQLSRESVELTPLDSPERAGRLSNHAIRLAERHPLTNSIADLDDAIHIMRQAVDCAAEDDPDRAMYMNNLGTGLGDRYVQSRRIDDLNESIQRTREAIGAAIDDYSDRAMYLNSLAIRLGDRYSATGEGAHLNDAIKSAREAISMAPDDDPDLAMYWNTLGIQLGHQYSRTGASSDLDDAIRAAEEAVGLATPGHPDLAMYLTNLAVGLGDRYSAKRESSDVESAIMQLQEALRMSEGDPASQARCSNGLSVQFGLRYQETGEAADLEESIRLARDATSLAPENKSDQAIWLNNLGVRLSDRYLKFGKETDLEEAIRVTEEALDTTQHLPDKASYLRNLGSRLRDRYLKTGAVADIERAIEITRQSIGLTAADPVHQAHCWNSLGNRLGDRYDVEGTATFLDDAISASQQAINLTPDTHSALASHLNGLGMHLAARYSLVGAMADLENAIETAQAAVAMTRDNKPNRALYLHNLGAALGDRYTRLKKEEDLQEAIRLAWETVALTPNGHPKRPMYLNSLSIRLGDRYSLRGLVSDLDEVIQVAREAANTVAESQANRAAYLNNVGLRLLERYVRADEPTDLEEAIGVLREAVRTVIPADNPNKATYLFNLGTGLDHRHDRAGAVEDREEALSHFQFALRQPNAPTIKRIASGIAVLLICADSSHWERACDAAELAVSLIPKLAPRSLENADRQHVLGQVVGLASDGAAAALQAGRGAAVALGCLEQGRGVLATFLQEMRVDVLELEVEHPELARQFLSLRDELDTPVSRSTVLSDARGDDSIAIRQQPRASRRHDAGNELDKLIAEIQRQPGFSDFLAAPTEADMRAAASRGPIVVLNTSAYRSDAILVEPHRIRSLALPDLHIGDAEKAARGSGGLEARALEWLWDAVARPVMDALGFTGPPPPGGQWPHVWWIATGALSKLPIHAAGRHRAGSAEAVLDRVVSSYSSSVKAILHGRRRVAPAPASSAGPEQALLVEMQDTPGQGRLRFARREVARVSDICRAMGLNPLQPGRRKHDVVTHLPDSRIFHFAGHGLTDAADPSQSQLLLEDWTADRLTVGTLMGMNLHRSAPFLAYLSACGTGQIGNRRFLDESIHLVGACQLAGFRHVVGTLWRVNDESCADVAGMAYEAVRDGGMGDDEAVARGLHDATRELRGRWLKSKQAAVGRRRSVGEEGDAGWAAEGTGGGNADEGDSRVVLAEDDEAAPLHWVPYVHFGV